MQPTPRLRVLSDRIPQVLVFVYFCRGLSGNMEERTTRWVYIEILTCVAIFYHLEDSRSHGNEREAERARGQGATLPLGRPPSYRIQSGSASRIMLHRPKGLRKTMRLRSVDPTAHVHLEGLYKQGLTSP